MASNVPIIRKIEPLFLIPHYAIMGLLVYIYYLLELKDYLPAGIVTFFILALALRNFISGRHRQGMRLVKQNKFKEAIPLFEKSVEYFTRNEWVDKYRYLTLLSPSKITYREMGLCNIAFCYSQTGDGQKAKQLYELVLREFPENGLARAGLNMLNSANGIHTEKDSETPAIS